MSRALHRFVRQHRLRPMGKHHTFRSPSGQIVIIREETRRSDFNGDDFGDDFDGHNNKGVGVYQPAYLGDDSYDGDSYDGGDDFDGEGVTYMDGDDFDGDDFGRQRRGRGRRSKGGGGEQNTQAGSHVNQMGAVPRGWAQTVVNGTSTYTAAASAQVQIRLQHDFLAQDLVFDGSVTGAKVQSIAFADRLVWNNPTGVAVSIFQAGNFMRGFLNGQRLKAGLDITVQGTVPGAGDFAVTMMGAKPYSLSMVG